MKIDREEKRSLKRLLVSTLVFALVVTTFSFGNDTASKMYAQEFKVPGSEDGAYIVNAIATGDFTAEEVLQQALQDYAANSEIYPEGMVVTVNDALDLFALTLPEGDYFPREIYFVMTDDVLCGCENLSNLAQSVGLNIYVSGTGKIYANEETKTPDTAGEDEIIDWRFLSAMNLTTSSGIDTSSIRFVLDQNTSILLFKENRVISNVIDSDYRTVYYNELEGLYKLGLQGSVGYVEEIGPNMLDGTVLDLTYLGNGSEEIWAEKWVYTDNALASASTITKLRYDNGFEAKEYVNPGVSFVVDNGVGVYSLEESGDEVTMTIYSASNLFVNEIYNEQTGTSDSVALALDGNYTYTEVVSGTEMQTNCDKVIFTKDAIPSTYTDYEIGTSYSVAELVMYWQGQTGMEFYFDMSNHPNLKVYNASNAEFYFENENNNELWVWWYVTDVDESILVPYIEVDLDSFGNNYNYAKAGETYTLIPDSEIVDSEEYTIYDVVMGKWDINEDGSRDIEYLADTSYVTYNTNGTATIEIPNSACKLGASGDVLLELESLSEISIDNTLVLTDEETGSDWYSEAFTIKMNNHEICDVTVDKSGSWASSITENTDGEFQKTYYVIDRSMEEDGVTPSRSYGRISKFEYSYVLDTSTPIITSVLATDANGEGINLEGGWLDAEGNNTVSVETVWTATPSITLNVIADSGNGLPVAEYKFVRALGDDADGEWQTSNTYTYTGDGVYDVVIHAKDEFDLGWESVIGTRPEAGMWVTAFGIDTSAPKLMFTDEKNATASELKADAQYEGNLQMVCDDGDGSGLAEINIYKKSGNQWVTSNELLVATEEGYYIAPNTQNEVYKIEVIDKAGNEMLYENITVVGKVQEKAAGTGSVVAEDIYFGQTVSPTATSDTNGTENVTYYYKKADAADSTYTTEVPTATGTYKVKAVFAETANYKEVVAEDEFTITRISATTRMYSITEPNEDGIYEESVVIRGLNGHQLAVSESGVYREQITLSESVGFFRFYIKTPEGAITDAVVLRDIVIELEVPPTPILAGRAHLDTGAAYELGEGTWNVSGDSTNYVGGTVFYVPESGDYEFTQQEGGQ